MTRVTSVLPPLYIAPLIDLLFIEAVDLYVDILAVISYMRF